MKRDLLKELVIYDHTREAYESVKEQLDTGVKKTCYIAATGVGKLYMALLVMRDNAEQNIIFITSRKTNADKSAEIAAEYFKDTENITFDIYINLQKYMNNKYDIIILDEFHRAGAPEWNKYVLTLLENNPDSIVIGTSATPIRYLENRNMASELFGDNIAKEINLKDAILRDILPYPEYYTCGYKIETLIWEAEQKLLNKKLKRDDEELNELIEKLKRKIEKADGVKEFFDRYLTERNGHYIVFCNSLEHLQEVKEQLPVWFEGTELAISEVHSLNDDNKLALDSFIENKENKLHLLLCIDMLDEGLHLKGITGVIMMRSTQSMNVYLQQIGRAFSANKENVPKIYDLVDNVAMLCEMRGYWKDVADAYKEIHPIINERCKEALDLADYMFELQKRDLDFLETLDTFYENLYMSWEDWIKFAEKYYKVNGDLLVPAGYIIDGYNLGKWIFHQREGYKKETLSADRIQKLEAIGMVWDVLTLQWEEGLAHAERYYKEHGDLLVPNAFTIDGYYLGAWIYNQRYAYKKDNLSADRIQKLEAVGMVWNPHEEKWELGLGHAGKYYADHGDLLVPQGYTIEGYNLGTWITNQRSSYKKGTLSADKIQKLEALGMVWNTTSEKWLEGYTYAEKYYAAHGDLLVPATYNLDGFSLGRWIGTQRNAYKKGVLEAYKIQKLEAIGMVWNPHEALWDEGFGYAEKYYAAHGDLLVSRGYIIDGFNLGSWINSQRQNYKKEILTADRIQKLETLGMVWEPHDEKWGIGYSYAERFYAAHGNLLVPFKSTMDGYNLSSWINNQRCAYKKGTLNTDKIQKLEAIGMVWDAMAEKWDVGYSYAEKYYRDHGNLIVPKGYTIDGHNLGVWIQKQRAAYKKGELLADRIQKLEAIGIVWNPFEEKWEEGYGHAERYYRDHGNLRVPHGYTIDDYNLSLWISTQRQNYKKGTLSAERVQKLEAVSMVWNAK